MDERVRGDEADEGLDVAIVGMSGRFPGAQDVEELWDHIAGGRESIHQFSDDELRRAGVRADFLSAPDYVKAKGVLRDPSGFDAGLFGFLPREAALIDPQQRVFLECAWEALEHAGYEPSRGRIRTGVFAGTGQNTYLLHNVYPQSLQDNTGNELQLALASDKDHLSTRVAYKLDLRGPAITVQTACSTSLVAVHMACQSLLAGECDLALAGGVRIRVPLIEGYWFQESGIASPDGHCRPFDARSRGIVPGDGAGVVVLKRLRDAMRDRDTVHAVIKASAINNDGASKAGYSASSPLGQAEVIAQALALSGLTPDTIGYVEAHGTATELGDPIEVEGLTRAWRKYTQRVGFCALGAIKANIGHLDVAAGVTGLIKAVMVLERQLIPPTAHFQSPNPKLGIERTPFYVPSKSQPWPSGSQPRRAAVSSFGMGGTNAHVILEEAPAVPASISNSDEWSFLPISARTPTALEGSLARLAQHFARFPDIEPRDAAFTLAMGRKALPARAGIVGRSSADVMQALARRDRLFVPPTVVTNSSRVAFVFPGQGSQRPQMGRELYQAHGQFRATVEECLDLLSAPLAASLRRNWLGEGPQDGATSLHDTRLALHDTRLAQPAIFIMEYALARTWMDVGISPVVLVGHSVGELVAACLAGVLSLRDALHLVEVRAQLVGQVPVGKMLAAFVSRERAATYLSDRVSLAAENGTHQCILSGEQDAIDAVIERMRQDAVECRALKTSHAFHSAMMDPVIPAFSAAIRGLSLAPARIPIISTVTGQYLQDRQAVDPGYWAEHLRRPVRFHAAVEQLLATEAEIVLEVGPGSVLTDLIASHPSKTGGHTVLASLEPSLACEPQTLRFARTLGHLWTHGVEIDWERVFAGQERRRIPLPTYPFERKSFWISPDTQRSEMAQLDSVTSPPVTASRDMPAAPPLVGREGGHWMEIAADQGRRGKVTRQIEEILRTLTGIETLETRASLETLGLSSLLMIQFADALARSFGVRIPIIRLSEDLATVESLVAFLEAEMSPEAASTLSCGNREVHSATAMSQPPPQEHLQEPPPQPRDTARLAGTPSVQAPGAENHSLETIIARQLELMSRQLELMRPQAATLQPPVVAAAATSASTSADSHAAGQFAAPKKYQPLDLGAPGSFSATQETSLRQFIARYTARTSRSKQLAQEQRPHLADNRASYGFRRSWKEIVYPILGDRSSGSRVWDVDGNEYIDFTMGFGVHLFGHAPPFLIDALRDRLDLGLGLGVRSPLAGEVAQLIKTLTGVERVDFCNSGTEAIMAAVRIARAVTGRNRIAMFEHSYHGWSDLTLVRRAGDPSASVLLPFAPGVSASAAQDVLLLEYGSEQSLEILRRSGHDLAAVLVEPVRSRHPDVRPREFLHELRKITQETQTALVFDEVLTGFRIHPGGAQAWFGVQADLVTYGKILGGGLPIGVIAGKAHYMDVLDGGMWQFGDDSFPRTSKTYLSGTYFRHPLSLAAARAILQKLTTEGPALQESLNRATDSLTARLNTLFERTDAPVRARSFASFTSFHFTPSCAHSDLFYYQLISRGIYALVTQGVYFLSSAHTEKDLDRIVAAAEESVAELQGGGFFASTTASHSRSLVVKELPMTEAQKEMWFLSHLDRLDSSAFNEICVLRCRGPFDSQSFRRALESLVVRHEGLRTTFSGEQGTQKIHEHLDIDLIQRHFPTSQDEAARQWLIEELRKPFELASGPLFRVRILERAPHLHEVAIAWQHTAVDGWSFGVLMQELQQLYSGFVLRKMPELPPAVPFSEYIQWKQRLIESEALLESQRYWLSLFGNDIPPLELPTDFPRPANPDYDTRMLFIDLPVALCRKLKAMCVADGVTLFTALLGAYAILLRRLTHGTEFVIGIPAAGQLTFGAKALVGYCLNVLPLKMNVRDEMPVSEYLRGVKRDLLLAYEHQDYPLSRLIEKLTRSHLPAGQGLIPTMINLDRLEAYSGFEGLQVEAIRNPLKDQPHARRFELDLNVVEHGEEVRVETSFNLRLFRPETVQRWLDYLATILEGMSHAPERCLGDLPMLSETERRRLLEEWNATPEDYPRDKCVHDLFAEQAARTPAAVAVVHEDRSLTYRELEQRSNQLAHHLQGLGVGPDVIVGLCLERSPEMVIGLLGILKAGGAYLPLDPRHPSGRLGYMLEDAKVSVVVTQTRLLAQVPTNGLECLCLDREWPAIAARPDTVPASPLDPRNLAYVIYTSGSTGKPKGVMVSHGGVVNYITYAARRFDAARGGGAPINTPLAFDVTVTSFYPPLVSGTPIRLLPEGDDVEGLAAMLLKNRSLSLMKLTPSHLQALGQILPVHELHGRLGAIVAGGEPLPVNTVRVWQDHAPQTRIFNHYGPTEATVGCVVHEVVPESLQADTIPIGRPIANVRAYVLDARLEPVPVGVIGELYIGGVGLARGYLNRPGLTSERFVASPFGDGERLYRTGDRVRYLAGGELEFMGRIDHQVKIRGYRIELGEIETTLRAHGSVTQALVVARDNGAGEKDLVGYVVGPGAEASELRAYLKESLPDYMVPSVIMVLHELPLTPHGKIDRKALPVPEGRPEIGSYVEPRTAEEKTLASIWCAVLKLDRVGIHDNFLDLGGHSLQAIKLIWQINEEFDTSFPLSVFFRAQTIERLATLVREARTPAAQPSSQDTTEATADRALVPSFAQQRLWFLEQLADLGATYNMTATLHLRGRLDRSALRKALRALVERHTSLRLRFPAASGRMSVAILTSYDPLTVGDLSRVPATERQGKLLSAARAHADAPFDLYTGPLFRAHLVKLGDEEHGLFFSLHHIISDGWSIAVLTDELQELYGAYHAGTAPALQPLPLQYPDHAASERARLQGDPLQRQLDYWREQLDGAPALLALPTDFAKPAAQSYRGAHLNRRLGAELTAGIKRLAAAHENTLFMTLLAAYAALLSRYSGHADLCIGTPVANRNAQTDKLIGFFVNMLVLRVRAGAASSFAELLEQVRLTSLDAYDNQDIPFDYLIEQLNPTRSPSYNPLFQVLFAMQGSPERTLQLPGLLTTSLALDRPTAKFDLTLRVEPVQDGLSCTWEFATDLFRPETIERMHEHFETLLTIAVADPQAPLSRAPLPSDTERLQLLEEWNDTRTDSGPPHTLGVLLDEQVRRTPEAIAVVFAERSLSYREMDALASGTAMQLQERGVGPDCLVAIYMQRSIETLVALWAILKAGGAYVPLDPQWPQERLQWVLEDCKPALVLTTTGLLDEAREKLGLLQERVCPIDCQMSGKTLPEHKPTVSEVSADHLAYVMYTSGSTGKPKGVMVSHGAVVARLRWYQRAHSLASQETGSQDVLLQKMPLTFDPSVKEIFWPLLAGARVVLARPEDDKDPTYLAQVIAETNVTILCFVPSLLQSFLQGADLRKCKSVRRVFCGGEKLTRTLQEQFFAAFPAEVELCNVYGPTEGTINATSWNCESSAALPCVPIGRPVDNTRAYILDEALELVPMGMPGELCIGAAGLARGYLNRPGLTAQRFVPNPFVAGERLYRTGDRARYRFDGTIEFVGRVDEQVKIHGVRIEPDEIEAALVRCAGVREAVVLAREDEPGEVRLVAYVTGHEREELLEPEVLRAQLSRSLPQYMVPKVYVRLETLPVTANGKVDRRALPIPDSSALALQAYEAPKDEIEQAVAGIWQDLLHVARVGRNDDFFALGGHSLLGMQLVNRVRASLGVDLPLLEIFAHPTLAELSQAIAAQRPNGFDPVDVQSLADEIAGLSEDELRKLLDQEAG